MTNQSTQLFHYILRMSKEDSAYFYFQLEANDGVAFYSTLDYEPHTQYRDIDLKGDLRLKSEMQNIISECQKKFSVSILVDEMIQDKKK